MNINWTFASLCGFAALVDVCNAELCCRWAPQAAVMNNNRLCVCVCVWQFLVVCAASSHRMCQNDLGSPEESMDAFTVSFMNSNQTAFSHCVNGYQEHRVNAPLSWCTVGDIHLSQYHMCSVFLHLFHMYLSSWLQANSTGTSQRSAYINSDLFFGAQRCINLHIYNEKSYYKKAEFPETTTSWCFR